MSGALTNHTVEAEEPGSRSATAIPRVLALGFVIPLMLMLSPSRSVSVGSVIDWQVGLCPAFLGLSGHDQFMSTRPSQLARRG